MQTELTLGVADQFFEGQLTGELRKHSCLESEKKKLDRGNLNPLTPRVKASVIQRFFKFLNLWTEPQSVRRFPCQKFLVRRCSNPSMIVICILNRMPSREFASTSRGGEVGSDDDQFKRNDFLCNDIQ